MTLLSRFFENPPPSLFLRNIHFLTMAPVVPGFANITGIFGCFNHRVLDPVHKPKTITFDAEIPIGEDDSGCLNCVKGILHYFVPSHENPPSDNNKYFVSGKIISISQTESDEKAISDYDLQIEALTVHILLLTIRIFIYLSLKAIPAFRCLQSTEKSSYYCQTGRFFSHFSKFFYLQTLLVD